MCAPPTSAWFLEIAFVQEVGMCFCVSLRLLLTSGTILTLYDWLNKFYSFYMAAVGDTVSRCSLSIDVHHRNLPNLVLYN